jgi:hypothetical protein
MKYGISPYNSEIWVRGQILASDEESWQPLGIYGTQEDAAQACTSADEFIGPVTLNQPWPGASWPQAYYPRRII